MAKTFDILGPADEFGTRGVLVTCYTASAVRDWLSRKSLKLDRIIRDCNNRRVIGVVTK